VLPGLVVSVLPRWSIGPTKGEKLIVVSETADGFAAMISDLWSLEGSKGVSFHTFSFPEDRCLRYWSKNICRQMPENIVREMETLKFVSTL